MRIPFVLRPLSIFLVVISSSLFSFANDADQLDPSTTPPASVTVEKYQPEAEKKVSSSLDSSRNEQALTCNLNGATTYDQIAFRCKRCADRAKQACDNPEAESEKSGLNNTIKQIVAAAPMIGSLAAAAGGEGMAQMQCYGNAIGAMGAMLGSKAISGRCKEWREGISGSAYGCQSVCSKAMQALNQAQGASVENKLQVEKIISDASKTCASTSEGEQSTLAQSLQAAQQMQEAKACMDALDGEEVADSVDCSKPEYSGHPKCETIGADDSFSDGLDLASADLADDSGDDEPTPFVPEDERSINPDAEQGGPGNTAGAFGGAGNLGAGGGSAGANPAKAGGGGRRIAKANTLINGHRGSGRSGSGARKKGKKYGGYNFKLAKDKKKAENSDALAALAAFTKAGIVPDTDGFIFERITNRFSATCNPKQFFDCTRNQISWYEQIKFKNMKK